MPVWEAAALWEAAAGAHGEPSSGSRQPQAPPRKRPASASAIGRKGPNASASSPDFSEFSGSRATREAAAAKKMGRQTRPASAPAIRSRKKSEAPPQVNMNMCAPMGCAPRWSIPNRHAKLKSTDRNPGPGQYDLVNPDAFWCKKKPSFSMAKPCKVKDPREGGPGPGAYVIPTGLRGGGASLGAKISTLEKNPRAPGPGTYEESLFGARAKRTSIGLRVAQPDSRDANPGPGTYEMADWTNDYTRQDQPKHGFPNAERKWVLPTGPGPGRYEPTCVPYGRTQPVYSFGTKCEDPLRADRRDVDFVTYGQFGGNQS